MQKTTSNSVENSPTPLLLAVVEKREYWVQIGDKTYKYILDGAHYDYVRSLQRDTTWEWLNFIKRIGREVSLDG